ncbi:hypothetical protein K437DRAFT_36847 [Tilletiaria anomala UBC 951]|uniref:Uncharacterized protein n=1 Tax=Tilletiaria anomala (strain ATCC 24038 / CBS 436.72 / UBC 951) TaxID=1037660 RepID=A0A066VFW7_TILAU|nr:uncharacterized protein K437DRAFT_36847 [Tilletiaria anomala UBC 951]KDN37664.1 hypothetical protein K437DRAFT_36847 [Tilletiaria anomala UBC 951]
MPGMKMTVISSLRMVERLVNTMDVVLGKDDACQIPATAIDDLHTLKAKSEDIIRASLAKKRRRGPTTNRQGRVMWFASSSISPPMMKAEFRGRYASMQDVIWLKECVICCEHCNILSKESRPGTAVILIAPFLPRTWVVVLTGEGQRGASALMPAQVLAGFA